MYDINTKLKGIREQKNTIKIMIMGLGSVGCYLLDYLCSMQDDRIEIITVGRNEEKIETSVNIVTVAASIRQQLRSKIIVDGNCDFENIDTIKECLNRHKPDIIVNASRVYSGLKYGSISWEKFRAYGIWTPLAIKYIKNIMFAVEKTVPHAIVINTSYSDAVIPWLKSANQPYPDFGSGNLNHLVPRLRRAVASLKQIEDFWNIEIVIATAHFHDVVISKEGHNEGVEQLIAIHYQGETIALPQTELLQLCKIAMPVDARRNMMNASSNFEIIVAILNACRSKQKIRIHTPGIFGEVGGYPVLLDGTGENPIVSIDETYFTKQQMRNQNKLSLALDGVEKIENGMLYYTDSLIEKVQKHYQVVLPKVISWRETDEMADFIIENIIKKNS